MKVKYWLYLSYALIMVFLASIFILYALTTPEYLELYDVKEERVGIIYCNTFHLKWHGRKTELEFLFYKRPRVAGYSVPGVIRGQWIQTANGNVLTVNDGNVCAAKDGDVFILSIPIAYSYVQIFYDNKKVTVHGSTGELEEYP